MIGNGGADYGSRGFVTAWDAETGKKAWKFYIVPGDPAKGPDGEASDSAMKIAQPTWTGNFWDVAAGGGGNAWDSFAYDPELNTVYIGTGNGSPHMWHFRSQDKGDNLFLCSMVAVDAKTGKYKWHYQMVPEEDWDFTCTQPIVLADIVIDGKLRKVAMQAPKNAFFYVIDRVTGELISGKSYTSVNTWASGIDANGRPIVLPTAHNTTHAASDEPELDGRAHLASDELFAAHRVDVFLGAGAGLGLCQGRGRQVPVPQGCQQFGAGLWQRAGTARQAAGRGGREREGLFARVGPEDPDREVARRLRDSRIGRGALDRRQSADPGHDQQDRRDLPRRHRGQIVGNECRPGRGRRADHLYDRRRAIYRDRRRLGRLAGL